MRLKTKSNNKDFESVYDVIQLADCCEEIHDRAGRIAAKRFVEARTTAQEVRIALTSEDKLSRRKALYLLAVLKPEGVIDDFTSVLYNDSCSVVRHEAAFFLGATKDQKAIEPLIKSLKTDPDDLVRHEAAEALGDLGFSQARRALEETAKNSPNEAVRLTALIAISQLEQKELVSSAS